MSLEYALERFPAKVSLRDGTGVRLRPMTQKDEASILRFFQAVPEAERLFIKCRVTDKKCLHRWFRAVDYELNFPLIMLHGAKVIGEATLHQRPGGWKRHIGLITVLTHPEYRGRDVAKLLVEELIQVARHLSLKKLEAELNGERTVAIRALLELGFRELCRLPDYLEDMDGGAHDSVLLGMDLLTEEEFTSAE